MQDFRSYRIIQIGYVSCGGLSLLKGRAEGPQNRKHMVRDSGHVHVR